MNTAIKSNPWKPTLKILHEIASTYFTNAIIIFNLIFLPKLMVFCRLTIHFIVCLCSSVLRKMLGSS